MKHNQLLKSSPILIIILSIITGLLLAACGSVTQAKETYTIGVVNYTPILERVVEGFKAGMTERGYVEGENVIYIYHGLIETNPEAIDREIKSLLAQDVDLLLMLGTLPALRAKQAVEGMDIPVIFAPAVDPVEQGLVESIRHPGGNVTGIQAGNTFPKALEWFYKVVPQATKIHIFYNPEDAVSISSIAQLPETAQALGFELSLHEMHAREEVVAAIEALPKDEAIFFIPTPSLEPTGDLIQLALKHGIVAGSSTSPHLEAGALVTYGTDIFSVGKQAARLVDQVFQGTAAGDLPVETSEASLSINLKTAEALSLNIPDEILRQADTIIR